MVEPSDPKLSVVRQCELLEIPRSSYYYVPKPESEENVGLMHRIDEIYTRFPYYGSPRMTAQLRRDGHSVNHKRVERLMRVMGLEAIYPKKKGSAADPGRRTYPYLLKGIDILRPDQVWGTDITYIRACGMWFYLVAMLDWHSRYVVSWRLSSGMTADLCVAALEAALKVGRPEIHNSDQGSQFTSERYLDALRKNQGIEISMDGRGRCFDNIFTERLWRTVKYEEVYLHDYRSFEEANSSLRQYFRTYNNERLHQSLKYKTPAEVYFDRN